MKFFLMSLTMITFFSSCTPPEVIDPNNPAYNPYAVPMEDPSNNYCVYHKKQYGGCSNGYADINAKMAMEAKIKKFRTGADGYHYKVLDYDYDLSGHCPSGFSRYEYYVAHECSGIAVDSSTYGPFPYSSLTLKKRNITKELEDQGYQVLYIEQNYASPGSSLYYLTFYIYKKDPSNKSLNTLVQKVQVAKNIYEIGGQESKPLLEVINDLEIFALTKDQQKDIQALKSYLKIIKD